MTNSTAAAVQASAAQRAPSPLSRTTATLVLENGVRFAVDLSASDPLIDVLLDVLEGRSGAQKLLSVPADGGRSVLTIPTSRLSAVEFSPPPPALSERSVASLPQPRILLPGVEPSRVFVYDNLFKQDIYERIYQYALDNEARFAGSRTITEEKDYRESLVLHDFPEVSSLMTRAIQRLLPDVRRLLNCAQLSDRLEMQLTAHNDGNYYKTHSDSTATHLTERELTYVFYFHGNPKNFSGGELKLYDTAMSASSSSAARTHQLIEPRGNRMIFFL
jgi:SM-20-related protein